MNRIIGLPADGTELSDNISSHFGHAKYFIGVELIDNGNFKKAFSHLNEGHTGCMEPVMNMKQRNVTDMILTGIGMRPFMGFQQVQVNLYQGVEGSIERNIKMLIDNKLVILNDAKCENNFEHAHTN